MFASPCDRRNLRLVGVGMLFILLAACSGIEQAPATPVLRTLEIHATEFGYEPNNLEVEQAGHYMVRLVNDGKIQHNLTLPNGISIVANPGETQVAEMGIPATGFSFFCSLPGHTESGMKGSVAVAGRVPASAASRHETPALQLDPNASPPPYVDPVAPAPLEGTLHTLDITAEEKNMTVANGIVQYVWTFNGTVPSPTMRVHVGDTIRIYFKNLATNKAPHSLDFHASEVAWDDEMRTINPGEAITVEWKVNYAGVYMYHCVTAPPVHHVASGMYGMLIVEPKEGLPKVDREFVLIQNEWYLGPQGGMVSLEKASAGAASPDFEAFNGVPFQYVDRPLRAEQGERLRFFILNVGPNLDSSFHIVGMVFDKVIKEGVALTLDNPGGYGSQAVDLAPAQGAIVETVAPEDGHYVLVNHAFNYHDRGANGVLQIGDGVPKPQN